MKSTEKNSLVTVAKPIRCQFLFVKLLRFSTIAKAMTPKIFLLERDPNENEEHNHLMIKYHMRTPKLLQKYTVLKVVINFSFNSNRQN